MYNAVRDHCTVNTHFKLKELSLVSNTIFPWSNQLQNSMEYFAGGSFRFIFCIMEGAQGSVIKKQFFSF